MKIIYLANVRIPTEKAHGIQIIKMCQAFCDLGHQVELAAAKRINRQFKGINVFEYYRILKRFSIVRLFLLDLVDLPLPVRSIWVFIQNTSFALSSFFYFLFKKADLIYSRDEFSLFFLSFLKKNLVLELHTFPSSKLFLYKRVFKKVKKIIVINNKLKELVINLGIKPDKILVAHDGVDLNQFDIGESKEQARRKLGLPLNKKLIIYTGQLFKWKGVYVLAQASQFLDNECRIIFVGGMEKDIKNLERFIQEKGLDKISILGHRPPDLIPFYLKASDVLVLPNSAKEEISRRWTSPMKMFEYMASKRPIVASDLPSLKEVLNDSNAILVEPDDSKTLAQRINFCLKKPDLSVKIATQAFKDVRQYTWAKRAKNIINFISIK